MQQFTRALTREIDVGGERLAVTLSKEGLSVRPVGGRRPPFTMSWPAWVCACVSGTGLEPAAEQIKQALELVRAGAAKMTEKPAPRKTGETPSPHAPPSSPSSASDADKMMVLLARLDQWLNDKRERFQQALQPGATAAECDALAAELGKPLPEPLRALLMWHNGQNPDVPGAFEQNWVLMSTEEIADAKKELDEHPHEGWQKNWLPFLDDDNGDYRCLDLGSPACPVLECWRGRADHPVVAPSLSAWLESFVAALERGAYAEDPERGTLVLQG
jgi:cell wall assembly regulator SMI1